MSSLMKLMGLKLLKLGLIISSSILLLTSLGKAEETVARKTDSELPSVRLPNIPMRTLGGKQFWTDRIWRNGWKIQQNAITGHFRLIDPKRVRRAWGSRQACEKKLGENEQEQIASKKVYILVHGLMRSSESMAPLKKRLSNEHPQSLVVSFEYASTRKDVASHAAALMEVVDCFPADTELYFVGHSLGNIVVRYALAEWQRQKSAETLKQVKRVVMLGPPNQGSSIAKKLSEIGLFATVTGRSGLELGPEWDHFEARLTTPPCPFGIVAGRLENKLAQNPLVDGVGDFVVSVDETKLDGCSDFLEVPQIHSFLMNDKQVQQAVLQFLDTGKFAPEKQ